MNRKILVTCPPMLRQIETFQEDFKKYNMDITCPDVLQTLSVSDLKKILPEHDGWIIGDDPANRDVFLHASKGKLKAAVKWGVGIDNVDFEACKEFNIPVANTPNVFGEEVANLAMCYILGLATNAFYIDREVRKGKWPKPAGISLQNKTIGIIGLGDIGSNIAKRAAAHNLNIIGWDPYAINIPGYIDHQKKWPNKIDHCDFIVFACSLNESNFHIFNDSILNTIKDGLRVINVSRGQLIDETTLIKGLKSKKIKSVALDVFEEEPININNAILNYDNCIVGSHNASNTIDAVLKVSKQSIKILDNLLNERNL
tara:strand:- start:24762 stop:25703 length:942 start_codon:yes stop_codon:yes gene_type:complete